MTYARRFESAEDLCQVYVDALTNADIDTMHRVFTREALVISPIYGKQDYAEFYEKLFADTVSSKVSLLTVLVSPRASKVAMHIEYEWTLTEENPVCFHCVDLFEYCERRDRFTELRIVYDTHEARSLLDA